MTFDAYSVYCDSLRERNLTPPSREWWDRACAKQVPQPRTAHDLDNAETEREAREGWT